MKERMNAWGLVIQTKRVRGPRKPKQPGPPPTHPFGSDKRCRFHKLKMRNKDPKALDKAIASTKEKLEMLLYLRGEEISLYSYSNDK